MTDQEKLIKKENQKIKKGKEEEESVEIKKKKDRDGKISIILFASALLILWVAFNFLTGLICGVFLASIWNNKEKLPKSKGKKVATGFLCLLIIFIFISIFNTNSIEPKQEQKLTQFQKEKIVVVFDVEALYGKNIDEIRAVLGEPTDGEYTNPTAQQLALGTKEWSNSFKKDKYELLVTYDVASKKVIDFFVETDDPSGATKDTKKLEKILNVENSTNFTIEPVKALKDPSVYTGIKVVPKK